MRVCVCVCSVRLYLAVYTPSARALAALAARSLSEAAAHPAEVALAEAHGTAKALGDAVVSERVSQSVSQSVSE